VYGRLKTGVTVAQARSDVERLFAASKADLPLIFRSDTKLIVEPLQQHRVSNARLLLSILLAAVGCLLLIACANVSNLLLGRWSSRAGEFAVRAAIGAGRARLARQLFTEAALLTAIGCALASFLVVVLLRGFVHYAAAELPRLSEVSVDARVFTVGLVLAILTTLLFGGLPALRSGRLDIQNVLEEAGRPGLSGGYRITKRALVITEIALSLLLLSGAALLLQTLWHLRNDRLGFQPEHAFTMSIPLKGTKLESLDRETLANELSDFARHVPGTVDAAQTECTPLDGGAVYLSFSRADRPLPEAFHRGDGIHLCGTGIGYPAAAGLNLIRGRFFTAADQSHPGTLAVINEAAARNYFPNENPLGKRILREPQGQWKTIIGVLSNTKNRGLDASPTPQAYVNEVTWSSPELQLIVRSIADRKMVESTLLGKLHSFDPGAIANFQTLNQTIGQMTAGPLFNAILVASFAVIAFLMSVIGVYGMLAFAVSRRTQEIGIRMALGAEPRRVLALILREGMLLVFAGVCGAAIAFFGLTRYLKSILYGVSPSDPVTFLAVVSALTIAAVIAMLLPARRAASVDPVVALRRN
jgi:putative ABC transport system permease protein